MEKMKWVIENDGQTFRATAKVGGGIITVFGNDKPELLSFIGMIGMEAPTAEIKDLTGDRVEAVKNASDALKGFSESMSNVPPFIIFNTDPPREVVDAIKTCAERGQGCTVEVHGLDGTVFVYPKAVKLTAEKICEGMAESQAKRPGSELNAINKRLEALENDNAKLKKAVKRIRKGKK